MPPRRTLANKSTILIQTVSAVAPVFSVAFIDVFFAVFAGPAFFAFAVMGSGFAEHCQKFIYRSTKKSEKHQID
jgi:hypothetical protein